MCQLQSKYPHGEISAAVINIISEFPEALEFSASDAHKQSVVDKENLFFEAAFAQNFIFALVWNYFKISCCSLNSLN